MPVKRKEISFKGQNVYVGIDTHLKSWKATIMLEHSEFKTFSMNPDANELINYLKRNFPQGNYYSAYEASFCGFSVHRALEKVGITNIVVNPADIPTTDKERKQKEDKRDSRKIAKSLRNRDLTAIYIPSIEIEELRSLVRFRKTLVKEISRNKSRVKSFLYCHGISLPEEFIYTSKYWSGKFTNWLKSIKMQTSHGTMTLNEILDTTLFLRDKLLKVTKELKAVSEESVYSNLVRFLRTIPGIGLITSLTIITEFEDIKRFKNFDNLCSFVGLVPTTNSSGETEKVGRITKRSNKPMRNCIIECAWVAIRNDPALSLAYSKLCARMKPNEAIIRIAKKLLNRIRYVLKNETEYVYSVVV